jgi:hypothetical protein
MRPFCAGRDIPRISSLNGKGGLDDQHSRKIPIASLQVPSASRSLSLSRSRGRRNNITMLEVRIPQEKDLFP